MSAPDPDARHAAALALARSTAERGALVFWWTLGDLHPAVLAAWRAAPPAAQGRWVALSPPSLDGLMGALMRCALAGEQGAVGLIALEWGARGVDPPRERALRAALPRLARVCAQARVDLMVLAPPLAP